MSRYKLGDYFFKDPNSWSNVPRDPVTIGTAIITGLGGSAAAAGTVIAFGVTTAAVVGYIATTVVTSWVLSALAPKKDLGDFSSSGILANTREAAAPQDFVYGRVRKGGVITFYESTGPSNNYLHQIICLAGHEVNSIGDIYINDEVVTIDGSNFVTGGWNSKIRIKKYDGSQTSVDSDLVSETSVDSSFKGLGIAYLYVRYEDDQDVFTNGLPLVTAVVEGKKVYDPRTTSTAYSNNAALCIRDFLTSSYGLDDSSMDDVDFSSAANICDENVTLAVGGTEKRYTLNGIVKANRPTGDVLGDMVTACAGTLFRGSGYWKLKVGAYTSPVKTLTLDDLRGPISLDTRISMRDNFNTVRGTFNDSSQSWVTADYPQITSSTFKSEDNNEEALLDLPLPFTTSASTAQRLAKLTLFRGREQMTLRADFGLEAFQVEVGDIISFTNSRYGFSAKEFEVIGWQFSSNQDAGDLRVNLTLRETSSAAFSWDAEESEIISNNTQLPDPTYVPPVGFSTTQELREVNEQVFGVITVNLTTSDPYFRTFESEYKKTTDSDYITVGNGLSNFEILALQDGIYDVRVRGVNQLGVRGDWVNKQVELKVFAPPPQDVSNFSGNVVGNSLHLTWTPVTDLDLSHYKIRYSPLTTGATYSNAVDLIPKVARPANSVVAPAQTGTYFIKAVDKVGGLSEVPTSFAVLIDSNNVENFNAVETITENPTFSGTRSDVVVLTDDDGNYLALDTTDKFDSASGDFDDAVGLFDGGDGSIVASGIYYFSNSIDLGDKYTSRVRPTFNVDYLDYANDFDGASGNFDDRSGNFDGDPDQFDTTSASIELRHTDDDPSGSPTWSDWQKLIVADISARALEFRVVLTSSSPSATPAVRALSVEIDMPERTESQEDITFTGSTSITFPTPFKGTPALGVSLANLADGERYAITSKSRSGFNIEILNGGSQSTNPVTLDYVAKGYGKELT